MNAINDDINSIEIDDMDSAVIQHGDNDRADARRRLEARLEDMRLRRELDDLW
jgi:hypothetical protein